MVSLLQPHTITKKKKNHYTSAHVSLHHHTNANKPQLNFLIILIPPQNFLINQPINQNQSLTIFLLPLSISIQQQQQQKHQQ
jgi:hypothetical protein